MIILPAIDLMGGRVVRLRRGEYDDAQFYGDDPVAVARSFRAAGAHELHIVDLDGAKRGEPVNMQVIADITRIEGLKIEVGGGIRTMERIEEYLALGVGRAILGTAAVRNQALTREAVERFGARIAAGVDARDGRASLSGWLEDTDVDAYGLCKSLVDSGVTTIIYTDIARDGMLSGANLPAYERLCRIEGLNVVASGGVSFEREVTALRDMGAYGVIVGKAIYEGKLSLPRLLSIADGEEPLL